MAVQSAYGSKCDLFGNDHIVLPTGTMDDLDILALFPASHNADVGILWVEYQIAGLGLGSENGDAVIMLHPGLPAVAHDVTPSGHNIEGLVRFRHGIVVASYDGGDIKPQIHP